MSNIRVGYAGSIAFFIGIIRLILGFVFITVVTRILSPEEYGTWTLIGGLLVYVLILHYIERTTKFRKDLQVRLTIN